MPLHTRKTDTLNRRLRFSAPQPFNQRIEISDSDLAIFEAIHRHGPLPTPYIHAFVGGELNNLKHRLTKLYNGTVSGSYLVRPPQQFASFYARYQPLVYDLHDRARQLLAERGRLSPFINRVDPFHHRLMAACVGASIEISMGGRYISRHRILSRNGNPLELTLSQFAAQKSLVPDDLFGIDYGGQYRFFAVEIDRNTESIERTKMDQNAFGRKLRSYLDAMDIRMYKETWGIPSLMVLTVTTNETHMRNMMAHLLKLSADLAERFLFKAAPTFGANWRAPAVLHEVIEPWARADGSTFDITKTAP